MRKYHVLSKNHKNEMPSRIIFYDTETDLLKSNNSDITNHKFKMVSACYLKLDRNLNIETEKWVTSNTLKDFHDMILKYSYSKTRLYVMAHNQNYDMIVAKIFPFMEENDFTIKKLIMDSGKIIISFVKGKRTIVFIDSLNWFKSSLKKLGESINIPKLEMPDFKKSWDSQEWIDYNKNDVVIVKEYFLQYIRWLRQNDMGNFGFTIASQSFNTFRHKFMKFDIHIHDDEDAVKLERDSYHGARTECFKIGEFRKKIFYLDVNSMYPTTMKNERYPIRLLGELKTQNISKVRKKLDDYCIIANVTVDTKEPVFCTKVNGKLVFPVGKFKTSLTTNELIYGIDNNLITEINYGYVYESAYIFGEFIDYMYEHRKIAKQEGREIDSAFDKLIMNSLYGKFGQQVASFQELLNDTDIPTGSGYYVDLETNLKKQVKYINNQMFIEQEKTEGYNSFCAIASHVTANSRLLLWKYIKQSGIDNVFYCDTDSIFTNQFGYDRLKDMCDDLELGKLKLETTSNYLKISGLKDYQIGDKQRLKGINLNTSTKINENTYGITVFPKLRTMINQKELENYYTFDSKKVLKRNYDKGVINSNGNVTPIILEL